MTTVNLNISLGWKPLLTDRTVRLMRLFGLNLNRLHNRQASRHCALTLHPGQICYITGASGAGKSVLLNALYDHIDSKQRIRLNDIPIEHDAPVIDCLEGTLFNTIETLSKAGLSDVFSMLKKPCHLSAGQQWRYRLAKALQSDKPWILADEFTASLDRITACVIAHNLRKIATRTDRLFVLSSCHEDILVDLQPDVVIRKYLNGKTTVIYKQEMGNLSGR